MSNARPQKYSSAEGFKKWPRRHVEEFKRSLPERFFLRVHMTLILLAVATTGVVASKLLLSFGLRELLPRYLVSVVVAYGAFFVFMRVWLRYVSGSYRDSSEVGVDPLDAVDGIDLAGGVLRNSAGGGAGGESFEGFGGGASDSWGDAATAPVRHTIVPIKSSGSPGIASSKGSSGGGFDLDFDEGAIVLVVFGVLLLVIFGAGAYLVYQAPAILSEAAFEALLASSLIKVSNRIDRVGFMGSIFKATWIPFVVVLAMTVIFGLVATHYCPEATKITDVIRGCPPPR